MKNRKCSFGLNIGSNVGRKGIGRARKKAAWMLAAAQVMATAFCCAGCAGSGSADVPELKEPVSVNEAYRPVEKGSIGTADVVLGTAVPTDYCAFYRTNVTVAAITVEIGDTVQTGDVLAYADIDAAKEEFDSLQEKLANENQVYEENCRISQLKIEKLGWQKQQLIEEQAAAQDADASEESQDTEGQEDAGSSGKAESDADISRESQGGGTDTGTQPSEEEGSKVPQDTEGQMDAAYFDTQIQVEQENARYDKLLHEYRVDKLQKSIADQQEVIEDGTLTAPHGGQVTYVKDLGYDTNAGASENVVIVSDPSELSIELEEMNAGVYPYKDYEEKYIKKDGKIYPVEELSYTSEEMILAKVNGRYPAMRVKCPGIGKMSVGEVYPVYFSQKKTDNVLIVGKDSIYLDGGDNFVYVRNEDQEKEKRIVKLGEEDQNYAEVVSGLEEGELVYYTSTSVIPAKYEPYEVKLADFHLPNVSKNYQVVDTVTRPYYSAYAGELTKIAVSEEQEVKAGDLLYTVNCGAGKAALTEMQNAINGENRQYSETMENYARQQAALEEGIGALPAGRPEAESLRCDLKILEIQKVRSQSDHARTLKQLQDVYDKASSQNDGSGNISVYADEDGMIAGIVAHEEDKIEAGAEILKISVPAKEKLLVTIMDAGQSTTVYKDNIAEAGEAVAVTAGDAVYTGHCIGFLDDRILLEKTYITSDEEGTYVSYNKNTGEKKFGQFYVQMDDPDFYEKLPEGRLTFSYVDMHGVVVLPAEMVHQESMPSDSEGKTDYVWRIVDGELVKQYVQVDRDKLNNTAEIVILSGVDEGDLLAVEE